MNSHKLVPENQINPFTKTSNISAFVDDYAYRPYSFVFDIPRPTYDYIVPVGNVSYIEKKKFVNPYDDLVPSVNFLYW